MIKLIDINKIHHHPDNPRKDLGDLTELTDSIKRSGILQNLTLVPIEGKEDEFYAVIGNRRLAAAKLAGLTEVPAAISDMNYKTQVATMLTENMQRNDLTAYEQAQGFQMMIDLGETVSGISEETGFSESTVRRRMKLLELDQDKLKESVERGGNLIDYMNLSKIKDIDKRNEVLEHIGTDDFNWKLNGAIQAERREEIKEELAERLEKYATKIEHADLSKMRYYDSITYNEDNLESEIEFKEGKKYYFVAGNWTIELYEEMDNTEIEEDAKKREEEERERAIKAEKEARIKEINDRTQELRENFIYSLTNTKLMKHMGEILLLATEARTSFYMCESNYIEAFNLEVEEEDFEFDVIEEEMIKRPALSLLKIIYNEDLKNASYFNFRGEYSEDKRLDKLYDILGKVGYEMSEEEKQLQDGTHEIFNGEE